MFVAQPELSVTDLCWHSGDEFRLANICFDVEAGSFVGILGPNGAGKSSLLRCLYGFIRPDSGSIALHGSDLQRLRQRELAQQVAVVTQQLPSGFEMTVTQFIATGFIANQRLWQRRNEQQEQHEIKELLVRVGLEGKANKRYDQLSGGEQQRLLIARAMLQQPKLLILDEPTNHLDVHFQIEVLELVRSLGMTVIASIHDLNLAAAYCDQLVLLDQGQVVAQGTPKQVLTEQQIEQVYGIAAVVQAEPDFHIRYHYPKRAEAQR